ncbi:MAG: zinc-dependent metalloprotease [Myxococcota bacterium]|nr:zinc-dependent metalloprotease [Myxococcota bacterium]
MNIPSWARALFITSLCACSVGIGDIDRTQPGKLKKSSIEGEWYYRQTVIDVPYTSGVTFIGEQSLLERIRWEVSEDLLTAYRSYERVENSEIPSQLPGTQYQGAPIAAFRILSHFDVIRSYNDATGEQTNVIVENTTDRPWYQREFIRVDWSQNLIANFDFLAGGESGLGVISQSASYAVTDPTSVDAPVFGVQNGKSWSDHRDPMTWGQLDHIDYFDLTLKLQVTPDTFPIYYDDGTYEEWPACWFYEYGPWDCASQTIKVRASFLRVQPSNYEPLHYPDNYVARDEDGNAIRTMYDPESGYRRCTSDEGVECSPVRIPMFDWFGYFRRERESYDRDYGLTEEGRVMLADRFNIWQQAYDASGQSIDYADREIEPIVYYLSENFPKELRASAYHVGSWWNEAFEKTVQSLQNSDESKTVFVIAENTFEADDTGIINYGQRNGDLRYNHLYWVDDPQFDSLLGYGPNAPDPITGEVIAADAYVYGAAIDRWAVESADIIELARGNILETDFIEGENVANAVASMNQPAVESREQIETRVQRTMQQGLLDRLHTIQDHGHGAFQREHHYAASRLAMGDNDPRTDALWNNEMQRTLEKRFGRKLAPSEMGAGRLARAIKRHRMSLAARGVDLDLYENASVLHLVDEFEDLDQAEVIKQLRNYLFKAVAAHEIGHTLGLRHNFAGSADALNYHDDYWTYRDPEAGALDLPTTAEMRAGLREYSYSSIMDYGARFSSDIRGIGKYDVAAIKFGYGQLVETFTNPPWWQDHAILEFYNLDDAVANRVHYTDLPALFETTEGAGDGLANMADRRDVPMKDIIAWMTLEPGATDFTDTLVPYKFCSDEYVGARWDCDLWDEGADPYEMVSYAARAYKEQYIFNAFKRNRRYLDPFEVYYSIYSRYMQPMASQYHLWLYDQWDMAYEWTWLHSMETDATENTDWNLDPHGGLSRAAAAMKSMNFFAEVIATPEHGSYYTDPDTDLLTWWTYDEDVLCRDGEDSSFDACSDTYIPIGQGKYAYSEFDSDSGYYWYEKIRVVGAFWDKLAAIETLSDPTTYFLGVDDVADSTAYNLGFNVAFPHAVETMFGAIINDDYQRFAPRLKDDGTLVMPSILDTPQLAINDTLTEPVGGQLIDPATNFTISLYAMYYGMALLNANFDQSFNDNARIWLSGHGESVTPLAGGERVAFVNPFNGLTYNAAKSPDALDYSLGFKMLTRANEIKQAVEAVGAECFYETSEACESIAWRKLELENLIENIEVLRGYYDIFGYAWF